MFFWLFFPTHLRGNAEKVSFLKNWNFFDKNLKNGPFFGHFWCSFVGKKTTAWSLISDPHILEPRFWVFSQVGIPKQMESRKFRIKGYPLWFFFIRTTFWPFPQEYIPKKWFLKNLSFSRFSIFGTRDFRYTESRKWQILQKSLF